MPARPIHASLLSKEFPFIFEELSSTLIVNRGLEQNRQQLGGFEGAGGEQSYGICQAYFMQNVLPLQRGYSAVNFTNLLPALPGGERADSGYILRGTNNNVALLIPARGTNWIYSPTVGSWTSHPVSLLANEPPQVMYLKNRSFIYYAGLGLYEYDFANNTLNLVSVPALSLPDIQGFIAAGAQLIAWSKNVLYWSSQTDPLDFVPSLATGAGSSAVLAIRSDIVTCAPLLDGFIVYTAYNAVSARATGNVQFPWVFTEVAGSAGVSSVDDVAFDQNSPLHITYTASGFQQVTDREAAYIWPDLTDGISRGVMSILDPYFRRPALLRTEKIGVKLNFVSSRWVTISLRDYNAIENDLAYSVAYVYDTLLERWGRLDVQHQDFLQFTAPDFDAPYTYQQLAAAYPLYEDLVGVPYSAFQVRQKVKAPEAGKNFGIITPEGATYRATLCETEVFAENPQGLVAEDPRIFLGRYKLVREQGVMLQWIKLDQLFAGAEVRAHAHDYTGKYVRSVGDFVANVRHPGQLFRRLSGDAISLEVIGKFKLVDLTLNVSGAGKVNQTFAVATAAIDGFNVVAGSDNVISSGGNVVAGG